MTATIHPLRAWREQNGLSHYQAADMFGVSRMTISRWERGVRRIDEKILSMVVEKTGIPATRLRPDLAALFLGCPLLEAMRAEFIRRVEAPDWEDLRGRAPDATGELSSEAFIRGLRDGWR